MRHPAGFTGDGAVCSRAHRLCAPPATRVTGNLRPVIVEVHADRPALAAAAARRAGELLRAALAARPMARLVAATGASQLELLAALIEQPGIDWARVELFHLDEYVGLPIGHPASFRRYLLDRLILPAGIIRHHLLDGEGDLPAVVAAAGQALTAAPIDLALVGIGENGHLAFNDPPADFQTTAPYLVVDLDQACRRQQVAEGWFASLAEVPPRAITMSVRQILQAREVLCVVPGARKAEAVAATLSGEVRPEVPASILRTHPRTTLHLDRASAARVDPALLP
jgi:glucosamine-6-phosphate deaminase